MKLKDVFEKSVQFFKDKKIESARLDAELLLAHALKIERLQIYIKYEQPLSETEISDCREVIRRRSLGEPVAYILGTKGFFGNLFDVGEGVLIPRPETEMIVEEALDFIKRNKIESPRILDLGAGSGCIGFSILKNISSGHLVSVEKSDKAFNFLNRNQEKLDLKDRSELVLNDVHLFSNRAEKFDIVVANPPYISSEDPLTELNVKKYEPASALFAEDNGYEAIFSWSLKFADQLKTPALMLFEIGHEQGPKAKQHFEGIKAFTDVKVLKDLSGLDRVIKALNNN